MNSFPGAMLGIQLDTTDFNVMNATSIVCDSQFIRSLEGIQYFDNLQTLDCSYNIIRKFTALPPSLKSLDCHTNQLDSLPILPAGIQTINCMNNNMKRLPSFPSSLKTVNCCHNQLDTLPSLNVLQQLYCNHNYLDSLPTLPNSLLQLDCSHNYLQSIPALPSLLAGLNTSENPLPVLPALPNSLTQLTCNYDSLSSLPTLPTSLNLLNCTNNSIGLLPALPSSLQGIDCHSNQLTTLPTLPPTLNSLICGQNQLNTLPSLPASLAYLFCNENNLSVLPALPNTLYSLKCASNFIPALPPLPASLNSLDYSDNPITTLPSLPSNLNSLIWNNNATIILPALPNSLQELACNSSTIDSLPILPLGLLRLECTNDLLSFLPVLPASLLHLNFSYNLMSTMPTLPSGLTELFFTNNLITYVPSIPTSTQYIDCSGNLNLSCLPKLNKNMGYLRIYNTSILCLPNFITIIDTMLTSQSIFTMALCTVASGCPCAWNITGNVHADTSSNCLLDSLNPGSRVQHVKVNLYKNASLVDQLFLTQGGEYSFDTGDNDTLDVVVDTTDIPFHVICPTSITKQVILSPVDSMKTDINFGVECNGIDAGVNSIIARFRPADTAHVQILAGNMAQFFNVYCPIIYSAIVTTIIEGPVQYLTPSALALTPSSVSGNMLTYYITDMSLIDGMTAFGIDVMTDMNAVMGSEVCITTTVSNVLADVKPGNNSMQFCTFVLNSFDPNAKLVSPHDNAKPGDWLTYTIFFQNTGSDTARKIIVRDTLSANLDASSFTMLASSHPVEMDVKKNLLTFYFNHINLPDSVHHEPQSHGWVQFKIRLKNNLVSGTKTPNIAAIYFDYNAPIITDTAFNYVGPDPTYAAPANPIKLPTAITPNNDGLNDSWHILNPHYLVEKQLTVESVFIMNRWGQKVYTYYGDGFNWTAPQVSASDVFVYYIMYKTRSGNIRDQRGEITVVK